MDWISGSIFNTLHLQCVRLVCEKCCAMRMKTLLFCVRFRLLSDRFIIEQHVVGKVILTVGSYGISKDKHRLSIKRPHSEHNASEAILNS